MIDWTKPIQTRDGRNARLICKDVKTQDENKFICLIEENDVEKIRVYNIDGFIQRGVGPQNSDILNAPERHEGWISITKDRIIYGFYATKEDAQLHSNRNTNAYLKITWKDGEGL